MHGMRVMGLRFKVIMLIVLVVAGLIIYTAFVGPELLKSWKADQAFSRDQIKGMVAVGLAVLFLGVYAPISILLQAKRRAQYASELTAPQNGDPDVMTWSRRHDKWVISRGLFWLVSGLGMAGLAVMWPWENRGERFVLAGLGPAVALIALYDITWRWKIVIDRREKKATVERGFLVPLQWRTYDLTLYDRVVLYEKLYKAVRYTHQHGPDFFEHSAVKYRARIEGRAKPIALNISYGCLNRAQMMTRPEEVAKFLGFELVRRVSGNADG